MAQPVECPTLDFSSGPDLAVCEFKPRVGLHADSSERAWDSLSPSLSAPHPLALYLSLKINKLIFFFKRRLRRGIPLRQACGCGGKMLSPPGSRAPA